MCSASTPHAVLAGLVQTRLPHRVVQNCLLVVSQMVVQLSSACW